MDEIINHFIAADAELEIYVLFWKKIHYFLTFLQFKVQTTKFLEFVSEVDIPILYVHTYYLPSLFVKNKVA